MADKKNYNSLTNYSKFNVRLRSLRKSKGWSQTQLGANLADILHISSPIPTSTIASWEHKNIQKCKLPSDEKIIALAKLFHVTADYIQGLTDNPNQTLNDLLNSSPGLKPVKILPQELSQHIGEPFWITSDIYNGWMLLSQNYKFIDSHGKIWDVDHLLSINSIFSVFPPYPIYFKHVYNKEIIPESSIRSLERVWVCLTSPDPSMQRLNGWYIKLPDESGVCGKTLLSYDSYYDFWIAYTTPLIDNEIE